MTWQHQRRVRILLLVGILALGAGVLSLKLAQEAAERRARAELLDAVSSANGVLLNGKRIDDPSVLLSLLRSVTDVAAHHTGPGKPIRVELLTGLRTTPVLLARDSQRPAEFWVFLPGPNLNNHPFGKYAGRVTSTELDRYLSTRGL